MIESGEEVLWHGVHRDKKVRVMVREGKLYTVKDEEGILWLVNEDRLEKFDETII
jgi:hypothetical protein